MEITHLPFLDVLQDITSKFNKIPNKDFINEGEFAIIDQGANIIAGYTNDKSVITDLGYPVIVFGDHTRIIKYINYPFAIGADGVKVLSVDTEKANPLYVFYFLKFLKIPNAGYSRHYKFLKEKNIALPKEIDDQKRIAKVLSQCEALIQKRKESIGLLDELLNSAFLETFKAELADNNKDNWMPLGQTIELLADYHANGSYESLNSKITIKTEKDFALMVRTTDLEKNDFETDCRYLNEEEYNYLSKSKIFGNEIIITKIGSAGNVYLMPVLNRPVSLGMNAFLLRLKDDFEPVFIYHFLISPLGKSSIMRNVKGAVTKTITKDAVRGIKIPKVEPKKQNNYKVIVEQVEPIKKQLKNSLKELENLYGSISQRAFNGELDLSKVDISNMEDSKKKDLEEVKEDLTEEQFEDLIDSFEHTLPTGEVPSNRETDIRNMSIRQYLRLPDNEETEGVEFSFMNKDFFYQFILTQGFPDRTFTLPELEQYSRKYILRGTGFEFTYDNWKTIIFRFIGAKQQIIEQLFDEETKTIKLKLTDEAFKV